MGEGNCTACDGGKACVGPGLTTPNRNCSSGYYCKSGAYSDTPMDGGATGDPCTKGHYCPEGTSTPLACPAGSYMNTTGYSYCFDCPAGFFCVSGEVDPLRCPRGRYCPGNTTADQPPCPTGTYNPDYGKMIFPKKCLFFVNCLKTFIYCIQSKHIFCIINNKTMQVSAQILTAQS